MVLKYTKEGKGDYERREIGGQVRVQNYKKMSLRERSYGTLFKCPLQNKASEDSWMEH